ncbi:hexokinase, putative [Talaromyces stipitatus ATCC 10500]|uniref:Phosphotransferase n=1 Tax=Talaromyces stipitatus (strain ATCC 10500 / CBS 375.48 / QM 6759 / NRRL 1006) TaxID=441959 RepID=B8MNX5_TALSN|nr:hexokinase, putative [Talaromyces stipitatus ATCC 10500]EED14214.1 hexokinase, putative [Talaromyces stipitatus ATCC 10500]
MISNSRRTAALPWEHWPVNNKESPSIDHFPPAAYTAHIESSYQRMSLAATQKPLRDFLSALQTSDDQVYDVACSFSHVFRDLAANNDTDESFSPVPITRLPIGKERGRYLAVDVGITTLKVAFIELLGGENDENGNGSRIGSRPRSMSNVIRQVRHSRVRRTLEKAWRIEERLKQDQPHELFLWIGNCIAEVVKDDLLSNAGLNVEQPAFIETGIAFGLPIKQDSLEAATLMQTGKGFTIGTDLDLRQSILQGYERHTRRSSGREDEEMTRATKRQRHYLLPQLKIIALTNDAVATLLSLSYSIKSYPNSRVAMGIVLDEGCNATIPMTLSDLHPSKCRNILSREPTAAQTLVSTEWTLHGASAPLREHGIITKWDLQLDARSARPGFQPLEYMTSGRYLGELIRIICNDYFVNVLGIAEKYLPSPLVQPYALRTETIISTISAQLPLQALVNTLNHSHNPTTVTAGGNDHFLPPPPFPSEWSWTIETANALREIAQTVQTRSAALVAAATVGLLASNHEVSLRDPNLPVHTSATSPFGIETQFLSSSPSKSFHEFSFGLTSRPSTGRGKRASWFGGPEELVVAYIGSIIQHYPNYKENCQRYIDRLLIKGGPQEGGKSVFLREATDGVIIGAGVLAGMFSR